MPQPREGEPFEKFIAKCVPIVIQEGTAKNEKQAYAICQSMFERWKKK